MDSREKRTRNYVHPQLLKSFYTERSIQRTSKVTGINESIDWDVYFKTQGTGAILENRGVSGVKKGSGTIVHKNDLARYIFRSLDSIHFEEKPNEEMLADL